MAGCGIPQESIATVLDIDVKTLRLHYRNELDKGAIVANTKVAANLFKIATGTGREAVTAAIFWLKVRAGWSESALARAAIEEAWEEPIGKKEAAARAATTAGDGTDWGDDLKVPGIRPN